jgi:hypothetical protein
MEGPVDNSSTTDRNVKAECSLLQRTIDSIHVEDTLAQRNPNSRDGKVTFEPVEHKYDITVQGTTPGIKYQSVTTWNSTHFESFKEDQVIVKMMKSKGWKEGHKYWGMSEGEIKQQWADVRDVACLRGELMHKAIEAFMNLPCKAKSGGRDIAGVKNSFRTTLGDLLAKSQTVEFLPPEVYSLLPIQWEYFLRYVKDHSKLVPFRTEWRIFDEDIKICGTIDMVYLNEDGTVTLHDWKGSKEIKTSEPVANFRRFATTPCLRHIPDLNYWHYVLQLNSYKYLLESKYGYRVSSMALVRIHETADNYELLQIPSISDEMVAIAQLRFAQINGMI